jgi:hypothetical protein
MSSARFYVGAVSTATAMARPLIRRFQANAYSPREAYIRATETPREVRALAEAVIGWALLNLSRDLRSALGSLPEQFGFRPSLPLRPHGSPYELAISDHTRLFVSTSAIWCVTADNAGAVLAASRFEPMRLDDGRDIRDEPGAIARARRCASPVDWVLAWNHVAASLRQLAEYEAWVQRRGVGLRREGERPKAARKTEVGWKDLPAALNALAEWAGDGELAMLSWVISDAKARGAEPELPEWYHERN